MRAGYRGMGVHAVAILFYRKHTSTSPHSLLSVVLLLCIPTLPAPNRLQHPFYPCRMPCARDR